jgi:hypothetical protein
MEVEKEDVSEGMQEPPPPAPPAVTESEEAAAAAAAEADLRARVASVVASVGPVAAARLLAVQYDSDPDDGADYMAAA